jgi:predicted nuclease of predicted toxin-antitoxin system
MVVELGLSRASDPEILSVADREGFIVVTHDIGSMQAAASDRWTRGETIKGLIFAPEHRTNRAIIEYIICTWITTEAHDWLNVTRFVPRL